MTDESKPGEDGRHDCQTPAEQTVDTMSVDAIAPAVARDPIAHAIDNLDRSLGSAAGDIRETQRLLGKSFGNITTHFVRFHSIAAAGERKDPALGELHQVVDAMAVELQIEDSLNQLLGHALRRIDSISEALSHIGSMVEGGNGKEGHAERSESVLAALVDSLESLGKAEHARGRHRFDAGPGSIDLF